MADTEKLKKMVRDMQFYSRPSNASSNAPIDASDLNEAVDNIAKVLNAIIEELEK